MARLVAVGRTSMTVEVVLEAEDRHTAVRTVTTTGRFVLVAVDGEGHLTGSRSRSAAVDPAPPPVLFG
jgi:acyl-CoA hydrolase